MSFRLLTPALEELTEAADFYAERVPGLGAGFIGEVDRAIDLIIAFPEAWGRLSDKFRRCNHRRFPYSVIYTVAECGEMIVVSVFHQSREPMSWKRNR